MDNSETPRPEPDRCLVDDLRAELRVLLGADNLECVLDAEGFCPVHGYWDPCPLPRLLG